MAEPFRVPGDMAVVGTLTAIGGFNAPAGSIDDADIGSNADVSATKIEHRYHGYLRQSGTAVASTQVLHIVRGATATLELVDALSIVACTGDATITIDVKKNGTTVLSASIVLDNGNAARVPESGTLSVVSAVQNDVLEAAVTVNAGSGALGTGLCVRLVVREKGQ